MSCFIIYFIMDFIYFTPALFLVKTFNCCWLQLLISGQTSVIFPQHGPRQALPHRFPQEDNGVFWSDVCRAFRGGLGWQVWLSLGLVGQVGTRYVHITLVWARRRVPLRGQKLASSWSFSWLQSSTAYFFQFIHLFFLPSSAFPLFSLR